MRRVAVRALALVALGAACQAAPVQATHEITPPETSFSSGPGSRTTDRTPSFRFSSSKHPSNFICKLDGGRFKPCASPKTLKALRYGRHGYYVKAIDAYGNIDPTAAAYAFKVARP